MIVPCESVLTSSAGYTDLPSRLPTQSSTLYSNNVTKFLLSLTPKDKKEKYYDVDLTDEVTRGAIVTYNGKILPPAPRPAPPPVQAKPAPSPADQVANAVALTPWQTQSRQVASVTGGMTAALTPAQSLGCSVGIQPLLDVRVRCCQLRESQAHHKQEGRRLLSKIVPALFSSILSALPCLRLFR